MSKQNKKIEHTVIHPTAEKVGAILLTGLSLLVSFEAIIEHSAEKQKHPEPKSSVNISEVFVRGEVKGEAGRLPEEFDIGLQTPRVAGL